MEVCYDRGCRTILWEIFVPLRASSTTENHAMSLARHAGCSVLRFVFIKCIM